MSTNSRTYTFTVDSTMPVKDMDMAVVLIGDELFSMLTDNANGHHTTAMSLDCSDTPEIDRHKEF